MTSYCRDFFTLSAHQRPTVGDIKMGVVNRDHLGWLKCDGRTLSVQQYYQLWQVIGYSFTVTGLPDTVFQLPNPAGTVPGIIGTGTDRQSPVSTFTFELGKQYGEYQHKLTIPEMPSHNHFGNTSTMSTGITILNMSTGITILNSTTGVFLTDPQHAHTYSVVNGVTDAAVSLTTNTAYDSVGTTNTGSSSTGITLTDPQHRHNYTDPQHAHPYSDPRHYHYFSTSYTGGDLPHNNVQPTLGIGNMFIYSGYGRDSNGVTNAMLWPYAVGTNLL
jgi:microcystin-dependent protein